MDARAVFLDAIRDGDAAAVRKLLQQSPSLVKERMEDGFTPLMIAVCCLDRTMEVIQELLAAGADARAVTDDGYTALHMMIDVNGPSGSGDMPGRIARLLVDAGADVEAPQHWGWSPLMRAAVEGTVDELRAMVQVGGGIHRIFPDHTLPEFLRGRTTLMATLFSPEKVRVLLDAGVDVAAKDAYGQTAWEYAQACLGDARSGGAELLPTFDAALVESLEKMKAAGIDPDVPLVPGGKTPRDSARDGIQKMLAQVNAYNPSADLRASMDLILKAIRR